MPFPPRKQLLILTAYVICSGVATTSIRCLAIAAECLTARKAQEEVLQIIDKIIKETGWRIAFLKSELQTKWGWNNSTNNNTNTTTTTTTTAATNTTNNTIKALSMDNGTLPTPIPAGSITTTAPTPPPPVPPTRCRFPSGIINPLMATADFSMANHPYQDHYVAPQNGLDGYPYTHY